MLNVEAFDATVEALERAASVIARCGIIEALYLRDTPSDAQEALRKGLEKLYTAVLHVLCKTKQYYDQKLMIRVFNLTHKQSLDDATTKMESAEQDFLVQKGIIDGERIQAITHTLSFITTGVDHVQVVQSRLEATLKRLESPFVRALDDMAKIHGAIEDSGRSTLLKWLSPSSVHAHHKELLTSLVPGTGEWLMLGQEFRSWLDSSTSETLWIRGIPGCGKTRLLAAVIEKLRDQVRDPLSTVPLAYFFCSSNPTEPERRDAREISRSLVKQLSVTTNGEYLRDLTLNEFHVRRKEAERIGEPLAPLTTEECTNLICELGRSTPLVIAIDAIDELDSPQRSVLLSALQEIRTRSRDVVKVLVTSRNEKDIAGYLGDGLVIEMSEGNSAVDLKRFVNIKVDDFVKTWSLIHKEDTKETLKNLRREIADTLIGASQGM